MKNVMRLVATQIVVLFFFQVLITLPAFSSPEVATKDKRLIWLATPKSPKAVVLCIHGLNNKPEVMDELGQILVQNNFAVQRLALAGHLESDDLQKLGTSKRWLKQIEKARKAAKDIYPQASFNLVAYSLGAVVAIRYADHNPNQSFDRMFLIAPAISVTWSAASFRLVTWLRHTGFSVPSLAPEKVRAHDWTPLTTYNELGNLIDETAELKNAEAVAKIPTQVVLSDNDALISSSGVKDWIKANNLSQWNILYLKPSDTTDNPRGHLLIQQAAIGESAWRLLKKKLLQHFNY